jgi:hypothetical protein
MSDPYQSRAFTFITKRSNRLKDTCVRGLRHLKVAVVWTGQILLYPLQLLAQTTKIFAPQLPPPPSQKSLPQPVAEINIEQALASILEAGHPILFQRGSANEIADNTSLIVDESLFVDENLWDNQPRKIAIEDRESSDNANNSRQIKPTRSTIRGLSSLLIDRQIVVVTNDNELLDILTTAQQHDIRRRIGLDLAIAWHQWRMDKALDNFSSAPLAADRELLLTNNIHEQWFAIDGENQSDPMLLSQSLDKLAPQDLSSLTSVDPPIQSLRQRWQNWFQKFNPKLHSSAPQTSSDDLHLPADPYSLFTPQPPKSDRFLALPQLPPIEEDRSIPDRDNIANDILAKLTPNRLKQWWNYYQEYLYIPSQADRQISQQPSEFKLIPMADHLSKSIDSVTKKVNFRETSIQHNFIKLKSGRIPPEIYQDVEESQDWIEVDSELIGYSKSPLARLFAWLDRVMLQIENWLISIWNLVR